MDTVLDTLMLSHQEVEVVAVVPDRYPFLVQAKMKKESL